MCSVTLIRRLDIKVNGKKWSPKLIHVGDQECVEVESQNYGLCHLVASLNDVPIDLKRKYVSIANLDGYKELKKQRNIQQAAALQPPAARRLFESHDDDDDDTDQPHKRLKQTREKIDDLRANPQLFDIALGDGRSITMQRPISQSDSFVIALNEKNLETFFDFLKESGYEQDDFYATRTYRASGVKGLYQKQSKNGKCYWYRDGQRTLLECSAPIEDQDGHSEHDDVVDAANLSSAEDVGQD